MLVTLLHALLITLVFFVIIVAFFYYHGAMRSIIGLVALYLGLLVMVLFFSFIINCMTSGSSLNYLNDLGGVIFRGDTKRLKLLCGF